MARAVLPLALVIAALLVAPLALAGHKAGTVRSLGGRTIPDLPALVTWEAEDFKTRAVGSLIEDAGATGGKAWRLPKYGVIGTTLDVPSTGVIRVEIRARGSHPDGLRIPHMHPNIDGEQRGEWDVAADWQVYPQTIPILAGKHAFEVDNFNNYHAPALDRTLDVDWVRVSGPTLEGVPRAGTTRLVVDAPDVHSAGTGEALAGTDARDGTEWIMWGVGCFGEAIVFEHAGTYAVTPRLKGNAPGGVGSHTEVFLDADRVDEYFVGEAWMEKTTSVNVTAGPHVLRVCYDNDRGGEQKRNLWMDDLAVELVEGDTSTPAWTPPPGGNVSTSPTPDGNDPAPGERGLPGPGVVGALLAVAAFALASPRRRLG